MSQAIRVRSFSTNSSTFTAWNVLSRNRFTLPCTVYYDMCILSYIGGDPFLQTLLHKSYEIQIAGTPEQIFPMHTNRRSLAQCFRLRPLLLVLTVFFFPFPYDFRCFLEKTFWGGGVFLFSNVYFLSLYYYFSNTLTIAYMCAQTWVCGTSLLCVSMVALSMSEVPWRPPRSGFGVVTGQGLGGPGPLKG